MAPPACPVQTGRRVHKAQPDLQVLPVPVEEQQVLLAQPGRWVQQVLVEAQQGQQDQRVQMELMV